MSISAMIVALQVGAAGPELPVKQESAEPTIVAMPCENTNTDEIVVCVRKTDNNEQRMNGPQSPYRESADIFSDGNFRMKLNENTEISGGGPKGSVGAGIKMKF